jgi:hypothetical protein
MKKKKKPRIKYEAEIGNLYRQPVIISRSTYHFWTHLPKKQVGKKKLLKAIQKCIERGFGSVSIFPPKKKIKKTLATQLPT